MAARAGARTRERVLEVALALFNQQGAAHVTTAEIAAHAGINEGNLYYYFHRKEQLIEALFGRFETEVLRVADQPISDPGDPSAYADYQRGWFGLMWNYRCFYRDGAIMREMAPVLRERLRTLNARGQQRVRHVFALMIAHGLMRARPEELDALISNIWIVSSYWMDFRRVETDRLTTAPDDLAWGFRQVEALYSSLLTERGRARTQ